jgi:hypothetical protein
MSVDEQKIPTPQACLPYWRIILEYVKEDGSASPALYPPGVRTQNTDSPD